MKKKCPILAVRLVNAGCMKESCELYDEEYKQCMIISHVMAVRWITMVADENPKKLSTPNVKRRH